MSNADTLQQVSSSISFIGALTLFASYFIAPKWRTYQVESKTVLFVMNVFDGIAAANYFVINDKRDIYCKLQTISIQFFEIGSWIYEGLFAIETLVVLRALSRPKVPFAKRKRAYILRNIVYLSIVVIYGLSITTYIVVKDDWELLGKWCWLKNPWNRLYLAYFPLWISMSAVVICNVVGVYTLRDLIRSKETYARSPEAQEKCFSDTRTLSTLSLSSSSSQQKLDPKLTRFLGRMMIGPMIFIMVHIPGSLRRGAQAIDYKYSERVESDLVQAQVIIFILLIFIYGKSFILIYFKIYIEQSWFDPSHGLINFVLYVLLDVELCKEWKALFWKVQISVADSIEKSFGISLVSSAVFGPSSVAEEMNSVNTTDQQSNSKAEEIETCGTDVRININNPIHEFDADRSPSTDHDMKLFLGEPS